MTSRRDVLRVGTLAMTAHFLQLGHTQPISAAAKLDQPVVPIWKFEAGTWVADLRTIDDRLILSVNKGPIIALNAATGSEYWRFSIDADDDIFTTTTIGDGLVLFGTENGNLYAVDYTSGMLRWQFTTGNTIYNPPILVDGIAFFGSSDGVYYAIDVQSGQERWNAAIGRITRKATIEAGVVYINSDGDLGSGINSLHAIDANSGNFLWQSPVHGLLYAPPVRDNVVYITTEDHSLAALDATSGLERWSFAIGAEVIDNSPILVEDTVFIGTASADQPELFAVDARTGEKKWQFSSAKTPKTTFPLSLDSVVGGVAIASSPFDPRVYGISVSDGIELWRFEMEGDSYSVEIADGIIYIGSQDNNVYAVDAKSGDAFWHFTGNDRMGPIEISDGVVYVGSGNSDGNVYALDLP